MPPPPNLRDLLSRLDLRGLELKEERLQAVRERRVAAERFEAFRKDVVLPVFGELQRELARQKGQIRVRQGQDHVILTVSLFLSYHREGTLRISHFADDLDKVLLEYQDVPLVEKRFLVELPRADRELLQRAVARLVAAVLRS
jgi:hypothetical protein